MHRTSTTGSSHCSLSFPSSFASKDMFQSDGPACMRKLAGNETRKITTIKPIMRNAVIRRISCKYHLLVATGKVCSTVAQDSVEVKAGQMRLSFRTMTCAQE